MASVFDDIVSSENDHTKLLRNLGRRHPQVASAMLSQLIGRDLANVGEEVLGISTHQTYQDSEGRAIPDVVISSKRLHCIVEVKTSLTTALTRAQRNGYTACFNTEKEKFLCLLVPHSYGTGSSDTEERLRQLVAPQVSVRVSSWQDFTRVLQLANESLADVILREATTFWKRNFEVKAMTDKERRVLSDWSGEKLSAIQKLRKTIEEVRRLLSRNDFETEKLEGYNEEYGFLIKQAGEHLLWVGTWATAHAPLVIGYKRTTGWLQPISSSADQITSDGYHLRFLHASAWDNSEDCYGQIALFLRENYTELRKAN